MTGLLSDEEYDRRLLNRMQQHTGRMTMPSWEEQRSAIADAALRGARGVGEAAYEILVPQTPADLVLMAALGPAGPAGKLGTRLLRGVGVALGQPMQEFEGEQPNIPEWLWRLLRSNVLGGSR